MMSAVGREEASPRTTTPDREMEKILSKLLGAIQDEIDLGCKHCAQILANAFKEQEKNEQS